MKTELAAALKEYVVYGVNDPVTAVEQPDGVLAAKGAAQVGGTEVRSLNWVGKKKMPKVPVLS